MRSFRFHATRPSLLVALLCALAAPRGAAQVTLTTDTSYTSGTTTIDADIQVTNGAALMVSGTATLSSNAHDLYVGENSSAGSLAITSGGTVLVQGSILGDNAPDTGTLTVDGSGALFVATGGLHVGFLGTGTATIVNGGVISVSDSGGTTVPELGAGTGTVAIGNASTLNIGAASTATAAAAGIINGNIDREDPDHVGTLQFNTTGTSSAPTYFTKDGTSTGTGVNVANVSLVHTAGYTVATGTLDPGSTTIDGGTLQIGNGGTTGSITGNVTNNSALVFNRTGTVSSAAITNSGTLTDVSSGAVKVSGSIGGGGSITHSGSGTLTLSGTISGSGSLTQSAGTTIITGTDTRTGSTTISGGTLQIGANSAGSIAGNITNNGTLVFSQNTSQTYAGDISGSGNVTKMGGTTLILEGNLTYTGTTRVTLGTLSLSSFPTASSAFVLGLTTGVNTLRYTGAAAVTNATVDLAGTTAGTTIDSSGTGALTFTGNFTASGAGSKTLTLTGTTAGNSISGVIANNSSSNKTAVMKSGTGTWALSGANTYTGATTIAGGTLSIDSLANAGVASPLGAPTGGYATIKIGSATTAGTLVYTGPTASTNRVVDLGGTTGGATLTGSGTGALTFTSAFTASGGGAKTLTLDGTATGNTIQGAIVNSSSNKTSLAKSGSGSWILSGTNTYTGTTRVDAGTLRVDGSLAAGSAVSVNSGGTLGGSGTINGTLAINSGGILAPGHSPGTLTAGTTTWNSGGTYQWEINDATGVAGTNWDLLNVTGALNLAATSESPFTLALNSLTSGNATGETGNFDDTTDYSFTFLTTGTGITGFSADKFQLDTSGFQNPFSGSWSVAQDGNALVLNYTAAGGGAIPEPSTYAALMGAAMLAFAWRRKRRPTQTA